MKHFFSTYIYIFLVLFFSEGILGQNLTLKITSSNPINKKTLKNVDYIKKHIDEESVYREIEKTGAYLKKNGYFLNSIEKIKKVDSIYIAFFILREKTEKAILRIPRNLDIEIPLHKLEDNKLHIPIEKLESVLKHITIQLDKEGRSFSKVQLKNVKLNEGILFADISALQSRTRTLDRIIIKGYEDFPKSFLKHALDIKKGDIFNQEKILSISRGLKSISFVKEIKAPEALFTKDSTLLYLYIKKEQNSSFDALVNFTSRQDGSLLFNGHVNLKLNNILNTGENFTLFWNSIGEEKQDFKISAKTPYIFNSPFTTEIGFNIYKQDSTFLNTKFESEISYKVGKKTALSLTYNSETSEKTKQIAIDEIKSFTNFFIGTEINYRSLKNDKFNLKLNTSIGERTIEEINTTQIKITLSTSYLYKISLRSDFFARNESGYLNSDNYINNELFRIGGANSIRGFNEQSIFTSKYSYFNIEYRYLTATDSYLYSITDFGTFKESLNKMNSFLVGLGIGYSFRKSNNLFRISYVTGKTEGRSFDLKTSKIIINWSTYF